MADPTTELASEFLEFNGYLVRKETKFYKNRKLRGTASDIDIIATRSSDSRELGLKKDIVAEAKNWEISKRKTLDRVHKNKFKYINDYEISWKQLKKYISTKRFGRVIFCLATTEDVYNYALKKYGIKIITTGFMIKHLAQAFKEKPRRWTYYPEWYNYNMIKCIMHYLFNCYMWKDRLTLEDLVWIDPKNEPRYRNRFVEVNAKFLEEFVYHQSPPREVLRILIERLAREHPTWFKRRLKSNKRFWTYLTKNV